MRSYGKGALKEKKMINLSLFLSGEGRIRPVRFSVCCFTEADLNRKDIFVRYLTVSRIHRETTSPAAGLAIRILSCLVPLSSILVPYNTVRSVN